MGAGGPLKVFVSKDRVIDAAEIHTYCTTKALQPLATTVGGWNQDDKHYLLCVRVQVPVAKICNRTSCECVYGSNDLALTKIIPFDWCKTSPLPPHIDPTELRQGFLCGC